MLLPGVRRRPSAPLVETKFLHSDASYTTRLVVTETKFTSVIATRNLFNFDNVSAEIGEQHRRRGACEYAREIEDADSL